MIVTARLEMSNGQTKQTKKKTRTVIYLENLNFQPFGYISFCIPRHSNFIQCGAPKIAELITPITTLYDTYTK